MLNLLLRFNDRRQHRTMIYYRLKQIHTNLIGIRKIESSDSTFYKK